MTTGAKRLLMVDDEAVTRTSFSSIFSQLGYIVQSAEGGFSALALIREFEPDILLSDLNMPGMSGFELLSIVRRLHPWIYVIATSGAFSGTAVPEGVAADGFYEKATGLNVLFSLVKAANRFERRKRLPSRRPAPIWTTPTGHILTDEAYVLITCPECLRAFPRPNLKKRTLICKTACIYCNSVIRYAVVKPDGELYLIEGHHEEPGTHLDLLECT